MRPSASMPRKAWGSNARAENGANPWPPRPSSSCVLRSAELNPGRLDLGELVEGVQRLVAANARLLITAERRGDVAAVVGVDPHRAGAQSLGELEGLVDVRGEDRRSESVDRVVGDAQRLLGVLHGDDREHRAEDLLLGDLHLVVDAIEHGGFDEAAGTV